MAIDPICGMTVDEASALCAERDGQTFYFCSDHCRQKLLSTPATAKHEEKPQGKAIYTCPMHPEVQQDHPGECPKCGMALEPKTVTAGTDDEGNAELRDMTRRFWIGAALTLPAFVLAMAHLIPALGRQPWVNGDASRWLQFALTTPVVWWASWPFFHRGWRSVVTRHLNMFTLIAIGVGAAFVSSGGGALPLLRLATQPDHCRRCDEPEFRLGHQQRLATAESEARNQLRKMTTKSKSLTPEVPHH